MSTKLDKIAVKAKQDPNARFTSLIHLIDQDFLKDAWREMNRRGSPGVDGRTMEDYAKNLNDNIIDLHERLKQRKYHAPPVRGVDIPKGNGKTRPLGIPTVEDRLLQRAVAKILSAIYEQDFLPCSFGFRTGVGAHSALTMLRTHCTKNKVKFVFEADIRGYFNHVNHQWLRKMIEHRIADPEILRLIGKWLRAGVMADGVVTINREGTPQGGPISPCLANVYLHYVLDLWFAKVVKPRARGEVHLVRFVDDFVVCFQDSRDAHEFKVTVEERFRKFGLETVPEKTRLLLFGRYAAEHGVFNGIEAGTFVFLGFNHVSGQDRAGKFALVRIPSQKSLRKFLDRTYAWLRKNMHRKRREQQAQLTMMLRGFYQYFSLHHCRYKLSWVRQEVQLQWIRVLRDRSQRHRIYWSYLEQAEWFRLPYAPSAALNPAV